MYFYSRAVLHQVVACQTVVSAVGTRITFERLIPQKHQSLLTRPLQALRDPAIAPASSCHLMLFVALDGGSELELPASNFWICDGPDHTAARQRYYAKPGVMEASQHGFPAVFLSFPSTKDSEWPVRFPGKSTAHIIAEARLDWFDEWRETALVRWLPSGFTFGHVL
jgi:all-trans-retinol 13,14-reductase